VKGDSFDIDFDEDQITIEHHVREERLSIVCDGDGWSVRTGPIDGDDELTEQRNVESRGEAWDCVIQYIDTGAVTEEDTNTSLNGEQR